MPSATTGIVSLSFVMSVKYDKEQRRNGEGVAGIFFEETKGIKIATELFMTRQRDYKAFVKARASSLI